VLLLTRPSTDTLRGSESRQVRCYRSQFRDRMEMRADFQTVGTYLDRHEGWFRRCAAPMEVKSIDEQAYALTLGRFGNLALSWNQRLACAFYLRTLGITRSRLCLSVIKIQP